MDQNNIETPPPPSEQEFQEGLEQLAQVMDCVDAGAEMLYDIATFLWAANHRARFELAKARQHFKKSVERMYASYKATL